MFCVQWNLQKMRNAVLDHLNNYAESVCIDCGFVQRDCKCAAHVPSRQVTFLSSAASLKDSSVQTEPMLVVSMQQKVAAPGISVLVPPNSNLFPDVRMPHTGGQQNALTVQPTVLDPSGMSINPLAPSVISLPPTLTFPAGYPPSFVNPLSLSSSISSTQPYVSVLRPSLPGSMSMSSTLDAVNQATTGTVCNGTPENRKRKFDTDVGVAHIAVQTTGKSYVKKMKIRLGNFSASDFKIFGRDFDARHQVLPNAQGATGDTNTPSGVRESPASGKVVSTDPTASPSIRFSDVKKDTETTAEKKYTVVWKLLEDLSDDECAIGDEKTSAGKDVPASGPEENKSNTSQAPNKEKEPCSGVPVVTSETDEHIKDDKDEEADSVSAPHTMSSDNKASTVNHNDHPMEEDDDDKLVIDTNADSNNQQETEHETSLAEKSNDWEYRNGVKEDVPDMEETPSTPVNDGNKPGALPAAETVDGISKQSAPAAVEEKCVSADTSPEKSSTAAADSADAESEAAKDTAETPSAELAPKPRRVYGKFEYTPTGEHILRCLVPKCSQTFDMKLAAEVHNHVHPGFVRGTDGSEGPTYLQCHRCEFQAPFYHWYDLLRHMREKHNINLVNSSAEHTCEYCGLGFETQDVLVSHIDFHYSNRYKCIYCGLLLLTWGQVGSAMLVSFV